MLCTPKIKPFLLHMTSLDIPPFIVYTFIFYVSSMHTLLALDRCCVSLLSTGIWLSLSYFTQALSWLRIYFGRRFLFCDLHFPYSYSKTSVYTHSTPHQWTHTAYECILSMANFMADFLFCYRIHTTLNIILSAHYFSFYNMFCSLIRHKKPPKHPIIVQAILLHFLIHLWLNIQIEALLCIPWPFFFVSVL